MNRLLLVVSLLVAVPAGAADALASPESVLSSCKEQPARPGERVLRCAGFELNASVEQPAIAETAILDAAVNMLRNDARRSAERTEVTLGGRTVRGLRLVTRASGGDRGSSGLAAIVPSATVGKVRLIGCEEGPRPSLCAAALEALSAQVAAGKGATLPPSPPPPSSPSLVGRPLAVPPGCRFQVDGPRSMLRCREANVSWSQLSGEEPAGLAWFADPTVKALAQMGAVKDASRPCTLDGVATTCRDVEVARKEGDTVWATLGEATVRGQRVLVQCNVGPAKSPRGPTLPSPCDAILRLR